MSERTAFEEGIRERLEGYEAPYDPEGWKGIENALDRMDASKGNDAAQGKSSGKWMSWIGGAAAVAAIATGIIIGSQEEEKTETQKNEEVRKVAEEKSEGATQEELKMEPGKDPEVEKGTDETKELHPIEEEKSNVEESTEAPDAPRDPEKMEEDPVRAEGSMAEKASGISDAPQESSKGDGKDANESLLDESGGQLPGKELPISFEIRASSNEGCPPLKVSFQSPGVPEGVDHFWQFGDGRYSNKAAPTHTYENAGDYDVTLTLTHRKSGAMVKRKKDSFIEVHPRPEGRIVEVQDDRLQNRAKPLTAFRLKGRENLQSASWIIDDGKRIENGFDIEHRFPAKGVYDVQAILRGPGGCTDTIRYVHEQKKSYNLLAPNAFEPNGDGRNDVFIPEALKVLDVPFTMTIHEPRSGRVVYKTTNTGKPWDGRIGNNGQPASSGSVFLWVVVLENKNGEEETYKGHVTVVR